MMYKVKNKAKTTQFWDNHYIEPGKSIVTKRPPEESYVFKVTPLKEEKNKSKKEEG